MQLFKNKRRTSTRHSTYSHMWQLVVVVVVSGMQLSRLRSAVRRHHPPRRAVLSQICCFGNRKWCCFRSCWTVLSHVMWGRPSCLQSARGEANRILLASALSSMRIICPNRLSRCDWIIAVSLGCFVSLRTSLFRINWYHLMPSSIRRHHWSSASILRASVLDITQQSEPYRNIGKMHVLYSPRDAASLAIVSLLAYYKNKSRICHYQPE